jgi:hypothetical protein
MEKSTGRVLDEIDPRYFRPTEVDTLLGDASKAQAKLGWRHKTNFDTLVADMVAADMVAVVEINVAIPTPEGRRQICLMSNSEPRCDGVPRRSILPMPQRELRP